VLAIAWITPVSANPPLLVLAIRKERHSYKLIEQSREFVVNIGGRELVREVLYCGSKSGRDVDKFKDTRLTVGKARIVTAPIVNECVAHVECEVSDAIPKGDHMLVTGKVVAAYVRDDVFRRVYDLKRFHPLLYLGTEVFATTSAETIDSEG
jgi:flavin reductase (DIM6/NTAB) family NADH-FMN oxidoreductase RutF